MKVRAEAMQLASEITPSGMMTVMYGPDSRLGFACSVAKEFCHHKELPIIDCRIASYLYPHCKVVAGNDEVSVLSFNNLPLHHYFVLTKTNKNGHSHIYTCIVIDDQQLGHDLAM